jgi:hypothetical protein
MQLAIDACDRAFMEGRLTWRDILTEEFMEALAESDDELLEKELVQVAAVATNWIADIRRRRP